MSKSIYLFKEHQKFQAGKTKLQESAVFRTQFFMIITTLLFTIASLWFAGTALRLSWQFSRTGEETVGELQSCRYIGTRKSSITYAIYQYTVDGKVYSAEDEFGRWPLCEGFVTGEMETVYYLSDKPQVSRIESIVKAKEWFYLASYGGLGLLGVLCTFGFMMSNRSERYEYHRLKHADTLLEARVIEVGYTPLEKGYDYARYEFTSPDGNSRQAQITSKQPYSWPKGIQKGDILHILYLDDDTFCVL